MTASRAAAIRTSVILFTVLGATMISAQGPARPADGRERVLVQLRLPAPHVGEGLLSAAAAVAQRRAIDASAARILARLNAADHRLVRRYQTVPIIALELNAVALAALR